MSNAARKSEKRGKMIRKLTKSGPKLDAESLARDRNGLGLTLPADYIAWLLQNNGGTPTPRSFRACDEDGSIRVTLEHFYPFDPADTGAGFGEHVQGFYRHFVSELKLPPHLIPIARDNTQTGVLLLDTSTERGAISLWEILDEAYEYDRRDGRVYPLFGSFTELIEAIGNK